MKLVQPIKMCLNESYSEHPSDAFPNQIGQEQEDSLSPLL
jgi:hypothetical protein